LKEKIRALETQVRQVKRDLVRIGDLHPGSLSKQYNVCGNPKCRCKEDPPKKHGPYCQLSWTRKGKSKSKFVREEEAEKVSRLVQNYARQRELLEQWTDLAMELCWLKLEAEREAPKERK